ncbi:MAG: hypothetical protein PHH37_01120 [Paludibacter sp.]|nr:hypothetical protein [Paludibacter sp.]
MNRKLLVTLLHKNIEELNMITDGFMEMNEYPAPIILLAKRKTEDIQTIIDQLALVKEKDSTESSVEQDIKSSSPDTSEVVENKETEIIEDTASTEPEITEPETNSETEISLPAETNEIEIINDSKPVEEIESENKTEEPEEKAETVIEETTEINIPEQQPEIQEEIQAEEKNSETENYAVKASSTEEKKTIIADKIIQPTISRNEILSKVDNSISASIANKKISDIKQAISIGDRFRFQRELFKSNGEDMNKTLNYINQLATFEEISSFLRSKYGWNDDSEAANDFYQIVRRKFL